jgi:integral membrane protein
MTLLHTSLGRLRAVAIVEGISFLLLLFVAMPMKYVWDIPQAVKITGMVHGLLFIAFSIALLVASLDRRWGLGRMTVVFLSSLIPFGTFLMDRSLKREQASTNTNPQPSH